MLKKQQVLLPIINSEFLASVIDFIPLRPNSVPQENAYKKFMQIVVCEQRESKRVQASRTDENSERTKKEAMSRRVAGKFSKRVIVISGIIIGACERVGLTS